ncbi:hypothetical protein L7F22_049968 [Adiantum nelumboides]|nr:hypothetical protein [Adiantum nelumboides]
MGLIASRARAGRFWLSKHDVGPVFAHHGAINQFGSDAQKERYLLAWQRASSSACFGLTEPNHGSDPSGMETWAEDVGEGEMLLNGSKTWISSSPYADVAVVWARCKWDNKVRGFLVDKGTKVSAAAPPSRTRRCCVPRSLAPSFSKTFG